LSRLAEDLGVSQTVLFLGAMFGDRKLSIMNDMDVFVHSSRWEGMPMAVLESAALGVPLLLSEATNMGDYVRRYGNGLILSENTPKEIANAMNEFEQLFYCGDIEGMGRRSLEMIEVELNWPVISKKIVDFLYSKKSIG